MKTLQDVAQYIEEILSQGIEVMPNSPVHLALRKALRRKDQSAEQILNKGEILEQMRIEMPFHLPDRIRPYIEEAMEMYGAQQSKAYANWLSNQVIAGRTATKLFNDYKAEVGTVV